MIPTAETVIQEGDYLSIFMLEDDADETHSVIDRGPEEA